MELIDRYLHAVRERLPRGQRDDIAAELRDILLSQVEGEEATRGRPLSDDEVAEILRRFGKPTTVAARYASSGYLIGPALYPSFGASMRLLGWVLGPLAAVAILLCMPACCSCSLALFARTPFSC
jgi:hypothetical protein